MADREPRSAARLQPRVDTPDGRWCPVLNRRRAPQRGRHQRRHWRDPVDVALRRGHAGPEIAPFQLGPRRRPLDRRKGCADSLHHSRLSPDRARREVRRPAAGFGVDGIVDLWEDFDQPSPKEGQIGSSSPPMIVGDVAIVGAAMQAGGAPNKENVAGHVRGYDVRTGKRLWIFHTVPRPGQVGYDTWLENSASYTGNTAVWAPMAADLELGYVYLPVETSTGDFYGGHRPGDNLFADSIVCLDARTGKRVWHFQFIHHDIWDY